MLQSAQTARIYKRARADTHNLGLNTTGKRHMTGTWHHGGNFGELVTKDGRALSWTGRMPFSGEWRLVEHGSNKQSDLAEAGRDGNLRAAFFCREPLDNQGYAGAIQCDNEDSNEGRLLVVDIDNDSSVVYQGDSDYRGLFVPCSECSDETAKACPNQFDPCPLCMCSCDDLNPGLLQACAKVDEALSEPLEQVGKTTDCGERVKEWSQKKSAIGDLSYTLGCQRTAEALGAQLIKAHSKEVNASVPPTKEDWHVSMATQALAVQSSIVIVFVSLHPRKGSAEHVLLLETFDDNTARIYNSWVHSFSLSAWLDPHKNVGTYENIPSERFGQGKKLGKSELENYFQGLLPSVSMRFSSIFRVRPKDC